MLGLSVFLGHSSLAEYLPRSSGIAIECFFVISGFYVQLIVSQKYTEARLGRRWWLVFYEARILRLYPMYLLACALVLIAALMRPYLDPLPVWASVAALPTTLGNALFQCFLVITNLTLAFQDLTMFLSVEERQVVWSSKYWISEVPLWRGLLVPQAWSLGIEMSFVVLAPALLNLRTRSVTAILAAAMAGKLVVISLQGETDPWSFRFFPFELGYFLMGALAFRFRKVLDHPLPPSLDRFVALTLPFVFVGAMPPFRFDHFVYPAILALVIPFLFRRTGGSKADRIIGEFSYPFYLFHLFIMEMMHLVLPKMLNVPDYIIDIVALAATFIVSGFALATEARLVRPFRARLSAAT